MSHREEPEEAGLRGPPPHRSKQPNGTPLEGGRPRWRPCQLHNPDAESQGQHHHHYHHQAHQHASGSSRAPPRHRRRHVPGQAQRRRPESGDSEARAGQQPKPGASKHHRSGERLYQHRYRQQHKDEEQHVKTPPKEQASEPLLSPDDSSQDLLTPSPQDEPVTDELDESSPDLSHSSDTQINRDPEQEQAESSVDQPEENVHREEFKNPCEEELVKVNEVEDLSTQIPEEDYVPPKIASKSRPESKRTSPLRVDVPPFATSPHQIINKPFFQSPRSFPESLRRYNSDPKSYPTFFNNNYACTRNDKEFDSPRSHDEGDLSDSEAYTDSYPESHPKDTETDLNPAFEEPQAYEMNYSMSMDECDDQQDLEEEPNPHSAVGSRLHHYDEQSGDEAESFSRSRAHLRETSSSTSLPLEVHPQDDETSEMTQNSTDLQEEVEDVPEKQDQITESCRATGDAVSLAIRDIKEAIEEVKTKTVRSPYMPDKITEPVWVMRQDVSPVEESHPQIHSYPQSPCQILQSSPQYAAPIQDAEPPLGAESSGVLHQDQDQELCPNVPSEEQRKSLASFPTYVDVPGPCDPEDLIDGIIFAANYLGSTQLLSERTPTKSARMQQAQEAMSRVRQGTESGPPSCTEVDLFISTQRIKVLSAYTQDTMMDHPLRTISYIADIGNMVVLMARRKMIRSQSAQENLDTAETQHTNPARDDRRQYKMICHVFESEDAQLIAQSIGQAFSVAYQEFLRANGIDPEDLSQREYSDLLNTQDMYNDDLIHFSKSENCRDACLGKMRCS